MKSVKFGQTLENKEITIGLTKTRKSESRSSRTMHKQVKIS